VGDDSRYARPHRQAHIGGFGRLPSQLNIDAARISARPVARVKSFCGGRDTAKLNRSEHTQCVYSDPSKVTPELVDRYFDMVVRTGNRRALAVEFIGGTAAKIPAEVP
jgi:hypothetical protein